MEREKLSRNIGFIKGLSLCFGGVYSNLQALTSMRQIANDLSISPSNIICTGDVVGYCGQPEEVVSEIREWGIHCIAGNVEIQLRENQEDCGCDFKAGGRCDSFSRNWYPFAQSRLSHQSLEWMKGLPDFIEFQMKKNTGLVVHGSLYETADFIFASTPWASKMRQFKDRSCDLIIAGHCGLPFYDSEEKKHWLNPGVIGMPANDGTSRVWYALIQTDPMGELKIEHRSFEYDYLTCAQIMREYDLPEEYAQTLSSGIWDNTEILPDEEAMLTGRAIEFVSRSN